MGCPFMPETTNLRKALLPPLLSTSNVVAEPKFEVGEFLLMVASAAELKVNGTNGRFVAVDVMVGVEVAAGVGVSVGSAVSVGVGVMVGGFDNPIHCVSKTTSSKI